LRTSLTGISAFGQCSLMPDNSESLATLDFRDPQPAAEFFSILGRCINEWSYVDRALFDCFALFVGADERQATIIYYQQARLEGRKQLTNELASHAIKDDGLKQKWDSLIKHFGQIQSLRTIIAHHPVKQQGEIVWDTQAPGGPKAIRARVFFTVDIEEKEVLRGKRQPRKITKEELEEHWKSVNELRVSLARFAKAFRGEPD
jgi:hypothetical protein